MSTGMILDGIFASQAIDSSGEVLDIAGCDISTLDKDGVLNYEHLEGDKKETKGFGQEIVGRIVYAKKIFNSEDCETDRERKYWSEVKVPFIYGMVRLADGAGHAGAQALAAHIRDHHANGENILVRYSIEGSTLERDLNNKNRLLASVARRVAATLKPCNRTCHSGIIEDPNAPKGFDQNPGNEEKKVVDILSELMGKGEIEPFFPHPSYTKLGGAHDVEFSPFVDEDTIGKLKLVAKAKMLKALTAGSYDVAPGSLVGGAALQREDRGLKARALAALRDYGEKHFKKDEFKAFAKKRLEGVDDDFLDHFADVAEDYHMKRLHKAEEHEALMAKKPKKVAKPKAQKAAPKEDPTDFNFGANVAPEYPAPHEGYEVHGEGPKPAEHLTIRGEKVKPSEHADIHFDENTGILHLPPQKGGWRKKEDKRTGTKWQEYAPGHNGGQFPMYIPSRDSAANKNSFAHLLENDGDINHFHDYAMDNWAKMNEHFKNGTLPPEAIMHAALFAQLSPNTPVPMQELMYGHLVDSMKHTGIDARDPRFDSDASKKDWLSRDTAHKLPDTSPEHWDRLGDQIRIGDNGDEGAGKNPKTKRSSGQLQSFMLANNKFDNMAQYHGLHNQLVDLIGRNKGDARAAVAELMGHKHQAGLVNNRIKTAHKKGQEGPAPYTAGPSVPGLAPKTARYTMGMLGGGNVAVPDTHFARYLFGLEKDKANATIEKIKAALWKTNGSHVLDGIDRYYAQHHDAVEHMVNHPKYKHLFKNREDAVFPAFWKNWVSIIPHEQARGYRTGGRNEGTDHRVFWDQVNPLLHKGEDDTDESLPARTATLHAKWANEYGDVPALMMYYHHLVPQFIAADHRRQARAYVRKFEDPSYVRRFEAITIDLSKAVADEKESRQQPEQEPVHFAGHHVVPGHAHSANGEYALLHEDQTHYVAVPKEKGRNWEHSDLVKLPKAKQGTHFRVTSRPSVLVADLES